MTQLDQWDEKTRGKRMSETTGRVIYKYQMPVLERFTMLLPEGAKIIRMADEGGMFWLWAEVRTDVPDVTRTFWAFKCGGEMPDDVELDYIGFCAVFVQQELGLYIYEQRCRGIEIEPGVFSGCDTSIVADCPVCCPTSATEGDG